MLDICSVYVDCHNVVFNPTKTICSVVGKQKFRISDVYLDNHVIQLCDKYLGVTFSCSDELVVDIAPVQRCFYVACNSVITRSRGVAEPVPVRVQLIKSFCLPLLVHCIV